MPTALLIHNTIMAMLVTGSHVPPARLHTIKTALHPEQAQRLLCQDRDCLLRQSGCMGNRFEIQKAEAPDEGARDGGGGDGCQAAGGAEVVRYIAPHHKNDRRGSNQVLCYDLPPGPLTQLMLVHIKEGHGVLTRFFRHAQPHLFMSTSGLAFNDVLFAQWWHGFYHNLHGPKPYFPPSKGRTLFVENFIASTGHQPQDSWEGAALAMGNSVKQWREFYAPRMKGRLAQEAVHKHQVWREGLFADVGAKGGGYRQPPVGAPDAPTAAGAPPAVKVDVGAQQASWGDEVPADGGLSPSPSKKVKVKVEAPTTSAACFPSMPAAHPAPGAAAAAAAAAARVKPEPDAFWPPSKRVKVEQPAPVVGLAACSEALAASSRAPPVPSPAPPSWCDGDDGWGGGPLLCPTSSSSSESSSSCEEEEEEEVAAADEGEWGDWGDAAGVGDDDEMDWEDEVEITRVVPPGARCRSPAIDLTYGE